MRIIFANIFIEFGPLLAFLFAYAFFDFFTAVAVSVISTSFSLALAYGVQGRFALFPLLTSSTIVFFGVLSILQHNESIFIFQYTVSNLLFAAALFGSLYMKRPLLASLFEHTFAISDRGWKKLTYRWAIFYTLVGVLNEYIRITQTPEVWVWFQAGVVVATIAFALYQFRLVGKERLRGVSNRFGLRTTQLES